jgi:large subunit ribosomal protein L7/L12
MPVMELCSLIAELETKWGVSARPAQFEAPVPLLGVPTNVDSEQTEFSVIITGVPADKKIAAIKVVRDTIGLGLKEAKDLVDQVSAKSIILKEGLGKADAEELVKKLRDAGCEVTLR